MEAPRMAGFCRLLVTHELCPGSKPSAEFHQIHFFEIIFFLEHKYSGELFSFLLCLNRLQIMISYYKASDAKSGNLDSNHLSFVGYWVNL